MRSPDAGITSYVNAHHPTGINEMTVAHGSYDEEVFSHMKSFIEHSSIFAYASVGIEHNGGFLQYPAVARKNGYAARTRSWYKLGKSIPAKVLSMDVYKTSSGDLAITLVKGLRDANGVFKGVLTFGVDLSKFNNLFPQNADGENETKLIIVDKRGKIIIDQFNEKNLFNDINELGIYELKNYQYDQIRNFDTVINKMAYTAKSKKITTALMNFGIIAFTPKTYLQSYVRKSLISFAIILGVVLAVTFTGAFILSELLTGSLMKISKVLPSIGSGNLTIQLEVNGNNEISQIACYFNHAIEKIAALVRQISTNASKMAKIGHNLSHNMAETASSVNQISSNIDRIKGQVLNQSAGVSETSATMEEIMRTIQNLNKSIETQAASVAHSAASVEQMVANIAAIGKTLSESNTTMQHLHKQTLKGKEGANRANADVRKIAEQSDALLEASSMIQNIASQTNLLAMNAAIEAAHAGDAGKGFAVVADEIRKLAEQSNTQGKQISQTIKTSTQVISSLIASGSGAEAVFARVVDMTNEVLGRIETMVSAMQEQERGSQEVLAAIAEINTVTTEVKDGSAEMLKGGEQVAAEMRKLDDLTRTITAEMNEMAVGAVQINNAVKAVNEMSYQNQASITNLTDEVAKFKV